MAGCEETHCSEGHITEARASAYRAARCSADKPNASVTSVFAPCVARNCTVSRWPSLLAFNNAVVPLCAGLLMSASSAHKYRTTSNLPEMAAMYNGLMPKRFDKMFTSALH